MEESVFRKAMFTLCTFNEVKIDQEHSSMLFGLMKDDFSDEEFESICVCIAKTENLFGKYPQPRMFYQYKTKSLTIEEKQQAEIVYGFSTFFEELSKELQTSITSYNGEHLDNIAKKTLIAFGGFREIYESVNREDKFKKSIGALKREMELFYKDNYKANLVIKTIENQSNIAKLKDLTKGIG